MATDVASKGLDFPAIQHVINYDMPEEIENYGGELGGQRCGLDPNPWAVGQRISSLSLQCTVSAVPGAQETQVLPRPSSTRPVVSLPPGPPQLSPGSSACGYMGLGYRAQGWS